MIENIDLWMEELTGKLKRNFGERLLFVGLQGSYRRREAKDSSDIDVVMVLDSLSAADIAEYRGLVRGMELGELVCGFISGSEELSAWPAHEIFQFSMDTEAYHGSLDGLLPPASQEDIIYGIRAGAANIYHAAAHCLAFGGEENAQMLKELVKAAYFPLLSLHYLRSGKYVSQKAELLPQLSLDEREILEMADDMDTARGLDKILSWSAGVIAELKNS